MNELSIYDICAQIRGELNCTRDSFINIGYLLKQIRDRKLYADNGYDDIWEFAKDNFGISKSNASRFMAINDKFSVGGNSQKLLPQYREFSSSMLSEMLTLEDRQLEKVTPKMTVKEIREMKPKKEKKKDSAVKIQDEHDRTDILVTGQMNAGDCSEAVSKPVATSQQNKEDVSADNGCNGVCFYCNIPECSCSQEKREHCIYDLSIECGLYRAREVAISAGTNCKTFCCRMCEEECDVRCDHSRREREKASVTDMSEEIINPNTVDGETEQDAMHRDDQEYFNAEDVKIYLDDAKKYLESLRKSEIGLKARRHKAAEVAAYSLLLDSFKELEDTVKRGVNTAIRYYNLGDYSSAEFYLYNARKDLVEKYKV